jgi:hypothetical protein
MRKIVTQSLQPYETQALVRICMRKCFRAVAGFVSADPGLKFNHAVFVFLHVCLF